MSLLRQPSQPTPTPLSTPCPVEAISAGIIAALLCAAILIFVVTHLLVKLWRQRNLALDKYRASTRRGQGRLIDAAPIPPEAKSPDRATPFPFAPEDVGRRAENVDSFLGLSRPPSQQGTHSAYRLEALGQGHSIPRKPVPFNSRNVQSSTGDLGVRRPNGLPYSEPAKSPFPSGSNGFYVTETSGQLYKPFSAKDHVPLSELNRKKAPEARVGQAV